MERRPKPPLCSDYNRTISTADHHPKYYYFDHHRKVSPGFPKVCFGDKTDDFHHYLTLTFLITSLALISNALKGTEQIPHCGLSYPEKTQARYLMELIKSSKRVPKNLHFCAN